MSDLISRQAAIDALCKAGCGSKYCGVSCDDVSAIEQLPSAQPDLQPTCNQLATDYISRQDVLNWLNDEWDGMVLSVFDGIRNLPSAQPEQRWIPCSERLPEDDVEVFVYLFDGQSPYIAWVCDYHWYTEDFEVEKENYPTAWMPLPEPWRGEEHE